MPPSTEPPAVAAKGFLVNGAPDGMRNVRLEELDPRAELIVGRRKPSR